MIKLHELGTERKNKKIRAGRGISSGLGKTAGRGTKGQKSRSGYNLPRRFEGGQTSLIQRLPQIRGFKSHRNKPLAISTQQLNNYFADGAVISIESLLTKGVISKLPQSGIKIIGKPIKEKNWKFEGVLLSQSLTATEKNK